VKKLHFKADGEYIITKLASNSGVVGNLYLPSQAYHQIKLFLSGKAHSLFIVGPPQSGKTTVLHEALPAMLAAQRNEFTPVVVKIKFTADDDLISAINMVLEQVKAVADAFDVECLEPYIVQTKVAFYQDSWSKNGWQVRFINHVAEILKSKKHMLWLLLDDDCHDPVVATKSKSFRKVSDPKFRHFLSELIGRNGSNIRVAMSISNVAPYLFSNSPETQNLVSSAALAYIGHESSHEVSCRIVSDIQSAMELQWGVDHNSQRSPLCELDPRLVVRTIHSEPDKLNCRPAIIRQLLQLYIDDKTFKGISVTSKLAQCVEMLSQKLIQHSVLDFETSLDDIDYQFNAKFLDKLRGIAVGRPISHFSSDSRGFAKFLCGVPIDSPTDTTSPYTEFRLIPPYTHLCKKLVQEKNVEVAKNFRLTRASVPDQIEIYVGKCKVNKDEMPLDESIMVSDGIVKVLLKHGIGARNQSKELIAVRSVFDHPLLCEQHRFSVPDEQFKLDKAAYDAWLSSGAIGLPPKGPYPVGIQVLLDLEYFAQFDQRSEQFLNLDAPRWRVFTIDAIAFEYMRLFDYTKQGAKDMLDYDPDEDIDESECELENDTQQR
jgi:hypothetical protein